MRPADHRAARQRRAAVLRALAFATALLAAPWLAPQAAASRLRAGKPLAEHSQPRRVQAPPRERRQAARRPVPRARPAPEAPAIAGVRPNVVAALGSAVRSTGIDPALLTALAWQESRFDPRAKNARSSARGLMQFTEATWLQAVRDHGPQHGLPYEAAVLSTDPASGVITARLPRIRARILELRDNPRYAAALAAARIARARATLELALLRPVRPTDLYLVHLLGPAGAQRFLAALDSTPARPAAEFVAPDSVALNREVFTERGTGRPLTLAEVNDWVARAIAGQVEQHAPIIAALGVPVLEVAEAR